MKEESLYNRYIKVIEILKLATVALTIILSTI